MLPIPNQFRCCDCERDFNTKESLSQHLEDSPAHPHKKFQRKTGCNMCRRTFHCKAALEQHKSSIRHQPLCHIKCLASSKCKKTFDCPSAQLHHLESGTCPSRIGKTQLNAAIIKNDVRGIITNQGSSMRLSEDDVSETSTTSSPLLTPTSTEFFESYPSPMRSSKSDIMDISDLTGVISPRLGVVSGFTRCPLCPPRRTRTYGHQALQQHLSSSVHSKTILTVVRSIPNEISFCCPLALMKESSTRKPPKNFSTVSGLAQHIECGACYGGKETLRRAVEYLQSEMKTLNLGGLKLLN
ncbi:uncharacterized protein FMAN_14109 [Fusarium mangiferae]|uniref:C2H2-type domain-containing protein n=1 Tax=Fusarium mangiferae TaxID=192010 RepID=A0A1L7ULB6_FUSMA|nr:uncharacterized protein FMAN_14109 [Fusarium mangiferae]CVL08875.1 uncharacterized protein FMAN_14109 [Fusarium mangiferae]